MKLQRKYSQWSYYYSLDNGKISALGKMSPNSIDRLSTMSSWGLLRATHIINELQDPIHVDGLKDVVAVACPDRIFVCSKDPRRRY